MRNLPVEVTRGLRAGPPSSVYVRLLTAVYCEQVNPILIRGHRNAGACPSLAVFHRLQSRSALHNESARPLGTPSQPARLFTPPAGTLAKKQLTAQVIAGKYFKSDYKRRTQRMSSPGERRPLRTEGRLIFWKPRLHSGAWKCSLRGHGARPTHSPPAIFS